MLTEALSAGVAAEGSAAAVLVVLIVRRARHGGVRLPQRRRSVTATVLRRPAVTAALAIAPAVPQRDAITDGTGETE